jgi:CO dehydrogenase nickel-insertion accessory protein CooC1
MAKIHLVMQGKGGIGKSLLAFYIAQYVREKTGKCLVFDTDPLNATLARTSALLGIYMTPPTHYILRFLNRQDTAGSVVVASCKYPDLPLRRRWSRSSRTIISPS